MIFSKDFWIAASERAIKSWAQTLASTLGAGAIVWGAAEWQEALIASVIGALLSVLTSIASINLGHRGSPSIANEVLSPKANEVKYAPVTGDVNAIIKPGFDSSYRLPSNPEDVLE